MPLTDVDFMRILRGSVVVSSGERFTTQRDEHIFAFWDPSEEHYQGHLWLDGQSRFCYIPASVPLLLPYTRRFAEENLHFNFEDSAGAALGKQKHQHVIYNPHIRFGTKTHLADYRLPVPSVGYSEEELVRTFPSICAAGHWIGLDRYEIASVFRGYFMGLQFGLSEAATFAGRTCIDHVVGLLSSLSSALYGRQYTGIEMAQALWNNHTCEFDMMMLERQCEFFISELRIKADLADAERARKRGEG